MVKNITLRLDEALLRTCRRLAVEKDKSLSRWVTDLIKEAISRQNAYARSKRRALRRLEAGLKLGGRPLTPEEIYER